MKPSAEALHVRHVGRGLLALFRGGEEVHEIGVTPGWSTRDRDEFIARYNAHAQPAEPAVFTAKKDALFDLWHGVPIDEVRQARDEWFARIRIAAAPPHADALDRGPVRCQHEAYHGACVHCGAVLAGGRVIAEGAYAGLHPATCELVRTFARAMADKLAAAEVKYGYSDGWAADDWMDECRAKLREHVGKGDPLDVANYCAFLWHHGASTTSIASCQAEVSVQGEDAMLREGFALPCRCGAAAEVDWSGCSEIDGKAFQMFTVRCTANLCRREVAAEIDSDREEGCAVQRAVIAAWNALASPPPAATVTDTGEATAVQGATAVGEWRETPEGMELVVPALLPTQGEIGSSAVTDEAAYTLDDLRTERGDPTAALTAERDGLAQRVAELEAKVRALHGKVSEWAQRTETAEAALRDAREDAERWKQCHAEMVERCALLRQRPDLPVDRIPAYARLAELQTENARLIDAARAATKAASSGITGEQHGNGKESDK